MLARFTYVLHLGSAVGATLSTFAAALQRRPELALLGLGLALVSGVLWWALGRTRWLTECRDSFDTLFLPDAADAEAADPRLETLLEQSAALEQRRGTPSFDPWAWLALQHEIKEHLHARRHLAALPARPPSPPNLS